jgi:hypothetical protein
MIARGIGIVLLLLAGFSVCYAITRQQNRDTMALASKVGKIVTLEGRFDGPGKIADYIIARGEEVYLTGNSKPDPNSTPYGTEVIVKGKLQHYVPPKDNAPSTVGGRPFAKPGEHYFIESAEFVGMPVTLSDGHDIGKNDYGRPVVLMAAALGVKPDEFRQAFSGVRPAHGRGPTGAEARRNKEVLMKVLAPLGVTNERMDEVANYYRFRPQNGELWPTKPAKAYAVVEGDKIKKIVVTDPGSGYCSPPKVTVKGFDNLRLEAKLKLVTDLKKNGGIEAVELAKEKTSGNRP